MKRLATLFVFALVLWPASAFCEDAYTSAADPTKAVYGVVVECLNAAGNAVPASSGQCANPQQAGNAQVATVTATVANTANLSGAIDLGAGSLVGIQTPSNIDSAAALTFQVSYDAVTFANFYDNTGSEYTLTVSASRSVIVPYADFIGVRAVKVRLGTAGSPVTATADRVFMLAKRP
jgi:hypothetical protein